MSNTDVPEAFEVKNKLTDLKERTEALRGFL